MIIMRYLGLAVLIGFCHAALAVSEEAGDSEKGSVGIELNKLEERNGVCRTYLVFTNTTGRRFTSFQLDLVMMDQSDVIAQRLAVKAAPLRAGKTTVKMFDIEDLPCAEIGRVLINDILECEDASGEKQPDCIALVEPSSKTVPLFK